MAKLGRNEIPAGHSRDDFDCFGPVATKDTVFEGCKMADLGCFKQDEGGSDSNKYYHASLVKSKKNNAWFLYVEYGRTKDGQSSSPQYQFTECASEADAAITFEKQCAEKNTKRGIWEKIGSKERFVPKPKKGKDETEDLYVVRVMASRSVGLPSAKNICNADAAGTIVTAASTPIKVKKVLSKVDAPTRKLFKDLLGGTIQYTRTTMVGNTMPALSAIEDARDLLQDALGRVKVVGDKVEDQVKDSDLKKLTYALYGMIPKNKPLGAAEDTWILSQENIGRWQQDLDVFESGLKGSQIKIEEDETDVMQGIPADVRYIPESDPLYSWLSSWWIDASRNRHAYIKKLKIHNLWAVERHGDRKLLRDAQETVASEMPKSWNNERPLHQCKERLDLNAAERKLFHNTNTALMFHGTRTVNLTGIVREGFRFPKELKGVVISGANFGQGLYMADDFRKSCGYCSNPNTTSRAYYGGGGEVSGRHAFMFAVDVLCGHPHIAPHTYGYTEPPKPHHSVFGKAGTTTYLQNNEWIIYKKGRVEIRYMAEISW